MTEPQQLMTIKDVAALLNVPPSRVYDRWRAWDLPAIRVGAGLRFRRVDVNAWLEDQRETA